MPPDVSHPADHLIAAFAEGMLSGIALDRIALHLDRCPECASLVAMVIEHLAHEELAGAAQGSAAESWTGKVQQALPAAPPSSPSKDVGKRATQSPSPPHSPGVFLNGQDLLIFLPGAAAGVARLTLMGRHFDVPLGPDGQGSIPLSSIGGGEMAGRAAAWLAHGADVSVELSSDSGAHHVGQDPQHPTHEAREHHEPHPDDPAYPISSADRDAHEHDVGPLDEESSDHPDPSASLDDPDPLDHESGPGFDVPPDDPPLDPPWWGEHSEPGGP